VRSMSPSQFIQEAERWEHLLHHYRDDWKRSRGDWVARRWIREKVSSCIARIRWNREQIRKFD